MSDRTDDEIAVPVSPTIVENSIDSNIEPERTGVGLDGAEEASSSVTDETAARARRRLKSQSADDVTNEAEAASEASTDHGVSTDEARVPKGIPAPRVPSRREREEHELTHLPYRCWCDHCVSGRGVQAPHTSTARNSLSWSWTTFHKQ